jgi:Family of unknown function (DUF6496)
MPDQEEKETLERAEEDAREGKAPTTQAGEFVREEIHHVREGKHGARSPQQAIAIGLSKARRAGIKVPRARKGTASAKKQNHGKRRNRPSRRRSRAVSRALRREGRAAGTKRSLARQAHRAASRRSASSRSKAARKAAKTRKREGRSRARSR